MSDFVKEIHNMFDHIWDCEIDHPVYQDTVGELMEAVIQTYEKHKPTLGTDLISRAQAIDTLENTKTAISENGERYIAKQNAIMRIDALPSAQPKLLQPWEVLVAQAVLPQPKRGKWIKYGRGGRIYKCNKCGNYLDLDGVNAGRGSANFCPNCGAKMEVTE